MNGMLSQRFICQGGPAPRRGVGTREPLRFDSRPLATGSRDRTRLCTACSRRLSLQGPAGALGIYDERGETLFEGFPAAPLRQHRSNEHHSQSEDARDRSGLKETTVSSTRQVRVKVTGQVWRHPVLR
eukprot:763236-Hanusia_phi.AAC.5